MTTYLGIDVGTTSVKALLLGDDGGIFAERSVSYPTMRDRGAVEQDPDEWLRGIEHCCAGMAESQGFDGLAGACIVSQANTHVLVDADFRPLHNAVTWQDQRAAGVAQHLSARLSDSEKAELWGTPPVIDASFSLSRWLWLRCEQPAAANGARWMLSPKDYCVAHLVGHAATDTFMPIGLLDADGSYLPAVLALAEGFGELQPPISSFDGIVGETNGRLGIPAGVPLAVGTMDAIGSVIGSGVLEPAMGFEVCGTSEIIGVSGAEPGGADGVVSFPLLGNCFVHAGPTQAGAQALAWAAAVTNTDIHIALAAAEDRMGAPSPVVFLPHLDGERAPVWNPDASGVWLGMSNNTETGDLVLGALEGVAFAARRVREVCEVAAGTRPGALRISGGGSRSDLWNRIKASAHRIPLELLATPDSGALGAALVAAAGVRSDATLAELAHDLVRVERTIDPDAELADELDRRYDHYRATYDALVPVFSAMAAGDAAQ